MTRRRRRHAKDEQRTAESSEAVIRIGIIHLMSQHFARAKR